MKTHDINYTKPYLWDFPGNHPYSAFADYKWRERKTDSLIFGQGHKLPYDSGNPNLQATLQNPRDYDLIFHVKCPEKKIKSYDCLPNTAHGTPPIVNERVLALLQNLCPNDFQDFPVTIVNDNSKNPSFENKNYYLINVTQSVDAIDPEISELSFFDSGNIRDIKKLLLKPECLANRHIARISNSTVNIIVSPELVSLFKKNKVTGVKFVKDCEAF